MALKLWLISQDVNNDYDTYDSAVVVAESEEAARLIHPSEYAQPAVWRDGAWHYSSGHKMHDDAGWAAPDKVKAECIGVPTDGYNAGEIICASFNAG